MKERFTIREIIKNDNPDLARLIREVFDEHGAPHEGTVYSDPTTDDLGKLFQKPGSILLVALAGNKICGCCGIYPTDGLEDDMAELVKFYLHRNFRGIGLGRTLMERCIDRARSMGYRKIYIESMPEFANAVRIYEKQGFRRIDHPLGNSGHITCNIWMVKELNR